MIKKIGLLVLFILIISCSLEHSNPLDPENSGIEAPAEITGIIITLTSQNHVTISWNPLFDINGYYVYRSFSEDGQYETPIEISSSESSYFDEITVTNYNCWYMISAYKIIDEEILEGMRSAPQTWNN